MESFYKQKHLWHIIACAVCPIQGFLQGFSLNLVMLLSLTDIGFILSFYIPKAKVRISSSIPVNYVI